MPKWTKEQESAIYTSGSNIIVSAGAGSGKTAVLTERVLQKVKSGISLDNLLILTFTNSAAKEMRERIKDKLLKENLLEEAEKTDTANITTFDAYALSLVKKYHYYLNLSRDINIIDASLIDIYKRNTINNIFNELYNKEDKPFLDFISTYAIKDDKRLSDYILNLSNKLDLKYNKEEYLNTYIENKYNIINIDKDIKEYTNIILNLINNINTYLQYIDDDKYLDKLSKSLDNLLIAKNYDDVVKTINNIKLPRAVNVSETTSLYKQKISDTIKEIKNYTIYNNIEEIKESILSTKEYTKVIINITKELSIRCSKYKNKYNYYEYYDISNFAIKLVRDNKEIREEIKNNLNEILIDEYQDTNDEEELFISYISNNNVYMVGDIKQSIYRFRNANPYIFKNKYDKYSNNDGGIKIDLNRNFRSREEVISNINLLFDRIMDNDIGGADYSLSHRMIFGNETYKGTGNNNLNNNFEIYTYDNTTNNFKNNEIEAFIIAKDIKDKVENKYLVFDKDTNGVREAKYSDFVILMSDSKYFTLYKKILEYNNVPTSISKPVNLLDGEVITIIKNIISFIIKISNNEYDVEFKRLFLSLSRSFIFNIDDNTILDYFINNNFKDSDIYKISYNIAKDINTINLDDIIDLIVDRYDIYNKLFLLGDYTLNVSRIDKLKEITSSLVNMNYDIYDYQKYLDDIISNNLKIEFKVDDSGSNTVKIMTIHASKGLEFSICYYGGLGGTFNTMEAKNKFAYDNKYGIILPDINDKSIYHNLSYKEYIKENISERIRLFYVALTRAKEKMILLLPKKDIEINSLEDIVDTSIRSKYNSFASILYSLSPILKDYITNIELDNINLSKDYNMTSNNRYKNIINNTSDIITIDNYNIINIDKEDKTFSKKDIHLITKEEENKLNYGKWVHEVFEYANFKDISNLTGKSKDMVSKFINNINLDYINIYKEYEFIYEEDNTEYHGIIDLMLEYKDYIIIIDYKLKNINDDAYIKQLNGYKTYIEKTFKKDTYIYLYSVLENKLDKLN